jgi:hypothetical protein
MQVADSDLAVIESRCQLKAEAARWAAKRRQLLAEGADFKTAIDPLDREMIARAKGLPGCFLWTNRPNGSTPSEAGLFTQLAGCFDTLAHAISFVKDLPSDSNAANDYLEEALRLLAEAQSGLWVAVNAVGYVPQDPDQFRIYHWLKGKTRKLRVFIDRHMTIDDPADPAQWGDLRNRIEAARSRLTKARQCAKRQQVLLQRVRYHLHFVLDDPTRDHGHDWHVALDTIEELVQDGTAPSSIEIRDLLLPVIDSLPDIGLSPNVQLVLREIDQFLSTRPIPTTAETTEITAEVRQTAELFQGKVVVLIGGLRRPESEQALVKAFRLSSLHWVSTRAHESITSFEPYIARHEVVAVLLAIRWSSHSFGDVKRFCNRYGKPLVRLPAGYGPNQVAVQVLQQVSGKLYGQAAK